MRIRVDLAEALLRAGEFVDARKTLSGIDSKALSRLSQHPLTADMLRVTALLALQEGSAASAIDSLSRSRSILSELLGERHWRTRRVTRELEDARRHLKATVST
jgi:hypothetical protein